MKFAVDLHIHSGLSPCGDNNMTPNNIVNMAVLKKLDIISVTDHNSSFNLPAVQEAASSNGIMLLPGIEVQTREEVHILCYFKTVDAAVEFGRIIYSKLPDIKIHEDTFGQQLVFDSKDNIINKLDRLLLSSAAISIDSLFSLAHGFGGVCVPAHIDRPTYSIISNLGFIPKNLGIAAVEISGIKNTYPPPMLNRLIENMKIITSSDAHYLWDISERENFIDIGELTYTNVLNFLGCR